LGKIKKHEKQDKSATTSRAEGMRMAPGRGRGHLCWWALIFKKNFRYVIPLTSYRYTSNIFVTFLDLCFIGSVGFDDHSTDSSLAVSCLLQPDLVVVVLPAYANKF